MAIKTKIFSSIATVFAIGTFSVFASAQTETPSADANKAGKLERKGEFGRRGGNREGMRGGRHSMRHGGPGMGFLRGVELTDAQKEQIKAIHEANKPSEETVALMKSIRETRQSGGTVTEEQKAQLKQLRQGRREKMKGIHDQILGILTPEQKAQIEARKAEMKQRFEERRQLRQQKKAETKPADIN